MFSTLLRLSDIEAAGRHLNAAGKKSLPCGCTSGASTAAPAGRREVRLRPEAARLPSALRGRAEDICGRRDFAPMPPQWTCRSAHKMSAFGKSAGAEFYEYGTRIGEA